MIKSAFMLGLGGLVCLSLPALAQSTDHCRAQARELAVRADSDIFPDMRAGQRAELRKLAAATCEQYAGRTGSGGESGGDWFTERVLHGEPADKPGNRRLEKRGR